MIPYVNSKLSLVPKIRCSRLSPLSKWVNCGCGGFGKSSARWKETDGDCNEYILPISEPTVIHPLLQTSECKYLKEINIFGKLVSGRLAYTLGDSGFFRLQGIKVLWRLQVLEYLRTLSLKFQKDQTKIEVVLGLPCWLSQRKWDSQTLTNPNVQPIPMQSLVTPHCDWLNEWKAGAPEKLKMVSVLVSRQDNKDLLFFSKQ